MLLNATVWIVLGLLAGFTASRIMNKRGGGFVYDIVLGVVGALCGGWIFNAFGRVGVTGLNLWSLLVAIVGAVVLLAVWHAIRGVVVRPKQ